MPDAVPHPLPGGRRHPPTSHFIWHGEAANKSKKTDSSVSAISAY